MRRLLRWIAQPAQMELIATGFLVWALGVDWQRAVAVVATVLAVHLAWLFKTEGM